MDILTMGLETIVWAKTVPSSSSKTTRSTLSMDNPFHQWLGTKAPSSKTFSGNNLITNSSLIVRLYPMIINKVHSNLSLSSNLIVISLSRDYQASSMTILRKNISLKNNNNNNDFTYITKYFYFILKFIYNFILI